MKVMFHQRSVGDLQVLMKATFVRFSIRDYFFNQDSETSKSPGFQRKGPPAQAGIKVFPSYGHKSLNR